MGKCKPNDIRDFTQDDVKNRSLIIEMLKMEDQLYFTTGQEMMKNKYYNPLLTLEPQLALQRQVLTNFGFSTDDVSLGNYRQIVKHYWKGPFNYDQEVLNSVVYLRCNKLLYYQQPEIKVGQTAQDVSLLKLNGTHCHLSDYWNRNKLVLVAAFSGS